MKEEFACFYGDRLDIEWGEAAGEFIRVEESRDGIEPAEVGAGEGGFARAIASAEEVKSRRWSGR